MNLHVLYAWLFMVCCVILCAVMMGSYVFLFYCKKTIDDYNVFFYAYNHKTKTVIDKYGDFRISNVYLIMAPITNVTLCMMNLVTMQNCKHILDDMMHAMLMVEIVMDNNQKKLILIEKTSHINILTDFKIDDTYMLYKIKMKPKQNGLTLRSLMNETCNRIGKSKFFNWHIYRNNCQCFIKQLVIMINDKFKYKHLNFISRKKTKQYCDQMFYNKCAINFYYSFIFAHNFFQKYINNVRQHVVSNISNLLFMRKNA